jgi:hypothetical protein
MFASPIYSRDCRAIASTEPLPGADDCHVCYSTSAVTTVQQVSLAFPSVGRRANETSRLLRSRHTQIEVIRFFQGIAESSTFVGTHYILGS